MRSRALQLASVLLLLNGAGRAAEQCTLAGRVTNAVTGEPVKKANLHLEPVAQTPEQRGYMTVSTSDGSFQFPGIEPGTYQLMGDRNGFLTSVYGAKRPGSPPTKVVLSAGQQITNVSFAMMPTGAITGRVMDDDGDPIANASVQVLRRVLANGSLGYQPQGGATSDDRGEFRVTGLEPGKYILSAFFNRQTPNEIPVGSAANTGPVTTYYPDVLNADNAVPLQMSGGQELRGIDIHVHTAATYAIRGSIVPASEAIPQLALALIPEGTNSISASSGIIQSDGKFEVPNVPSGSYRMILLDNNHGSALVGSQMVHVDGADLNGVVLNIIPPGTLRGRARVEGTPPAGSAPWSVKTVMVQLGPADSGPQFGGTGEFAMAEDGTFTIQNIAMGTYKIVAYDGVDQTYLKTVRLNGQDVSDKPLDLSQGAAGELDIVFSYGAPELRGTVQSEGTPALGMVVLARGESRQVVNSAPTEQNGAFRFTGLVPGKYTVYAFEDFHDGEVVSPELMKALESKSVEIELKENDSKQIELPLISADEMQQTLVRLGLDTR